MPKIQFKRGAEAKLPILSEGEPGFTTDTKRFLVGSASGNVELSKKDDVDGLKARVDGHDNSISSLTNEVNGHDNSISTLTSTVSGHSDSISALNTSVSNNTTEIQNARGGSSTLKQRLDGVDTTISGKANQSDVTSLTTQMADKAQKVDVNNNTAELRKEFANKQLENLFNSKKSQANQYGEIYNVMQYTEQLDANWYTQGKTNVNDQIVIDGIKLTKLSTNNFYNSISTVNNLINTTAGNKYLCSFYALTFDKPFFFYMDNLAAATTNVTKVAFVDNKLRRFKFVVDGGKDINWYLQGNSGYNKSGTSYTNNLYIGGFQVEQIPIDGSIKNGIAVIGDSTVQFDAGTWDGMTNQSWTKFLAGFLGVEVYNRGIGGQGTQSMIDRWATDMTPLASKCKYAIILGGINDLATLTSDQILANHQTMDTKAVADGFIPVHLTITPCNASMNDATLETKRLDANSKILSTFANSIDITQVVTDPIKTNSLLNYGDWLNDNTHYGVSARIAIANYIANQFTWSFREPKPYQRVKDTNIFDTNYLRTNTAFYDNSGNKKIEIKDLGTGERLYLYDGSNQSFFQFYSSIMLLENDAGEITILPKVGTKINLKERVEVEKGLTVPLQAPTSIGDGQIWFDNTTKQLKFSASGATKTITFT